MGEDTTSFKFRKKAELVVRNQFDPINIKDMDFEKVINELRIHQVELEMQNEELIESQIKLENSRRKYFDLYNLAPVSYFTLDEKGLIIDVNLFGAFLLDIEIKDLYGNAFIRFINPEDQNKFYHLWQKAMKTGDKETSEIKMITNNGKTFHAHLESILKFDEMNNGLNIALFNINDRKNNEDKIKLSLNEKEVLIREIHHRVKNNLQIIASLLHLQEHTADDEVIAVLKESQGRVMTMATIHENLYQSPTFNDINCKQYIEKLIYDILSTYGISKGRIKTNLNIEEIKLNIDTAIPLGLIINELVTNIVKYAFHDIEGSITIILKSYPDRIELIIADNGIGLPEDIDIENSETLGLQLVYNLINQLDGKLKISLDNGTEFKIVFKELKYKIRS
jgi:two-component sensor histidine kinase/PAS domain-containing protein